MKSKQQLEAELHSNNRAAVLGMAIQPAFKSYRIRWAWTKGRQTFTAVTTWVFPGDAAQALANFLKRRPEATTASVERVLS